MFAANPSRPGATFFLIFVKDQSCDLRYYRISSPAEKSQLKRAAKWRPFLFRPNQDLSNRSIHRSKLLTKDEARRIACRSPAAAMAAGMRPDPCRGAEEGEAPAGSVAEPSFDDRPGGNQSCDNPGDTTDPRPKKNFLFSSPTGEGFAAKPSNRELAFGSGVSSCINP
jgi:hypothetical protein